MRVTLGNKILLLPLNLIIHSGLFFNEDIQPPYQQNLPPDRFKQV